MNRNEAYTLGLDLGRDIGDISAVHYSWPTYIRDCYRLISEHADQSLVFGRNLQKSYDIGIIEGLALSWRGRGCRVPYWNDDQKCYRDPGGARLFCL